MQHSKVYGVFFQVPYEGAELLGLYFLEGEAEAARDVYIDESIMAFVDEQGDLVTKQDIASELRYYQDNTIVKMLPVGLPVASTGVVVSL
jgi:hypothetical protein